jgi:hypothetical protein
MNIRERTRTVSPSLWARVHGSYQRNAARRLFSRPFTVNPPGPIVSFTFDDFPRSAWLVGGAILERFQIRGTYYASFGLIGTTGPTGPIFEPGDVKRLLERGHEIGSHTFDHCHSWDTSRNVFERSILKNDAALKSLVSNASFRTFAYPISPPRPLTKRQAARHFACCRGGGQIVNSGSTDLNYLHACFLEQTRNDVEIVKSLIDRNRQACGWLILATHDVDGNPTRYGCTPDFFESVVRYAVNSGSRILPVIEALDELQAPVLAGI